MDQSEVLKFEQQKQITKLSEAIREGAKLRPQCYGVFFDGGGTCALGAAAEARGWLPQRRVCPVNFLQDVMVGHVMSKLGGAVAMMNDGTMSREAIADVLEAQGY